MLAAVLALDPGPLQKGSVRQNVRRRPELVEELLGREQRVNPSAVMGSDNASIAAGTLKGKGAGKCTGLQPPGPVLDSRTANLGP
jgi:hypothetical protein